MTKSSSRLRLLLLAFSLNFFAFADSSAAQERADVGNSRADVVSSLTLLRNSDILNMVAQKTAPEVIVTKILTSHCGFDTFPPVLRELKSKGVPDSVLEAMVNSPNGPPILNPPDENYEQPIYHYADALKQMNALSAPTSQRRGTSYGESRRARSILRRDW